MVTIVLLANSQVGLQSQADQHLHSVQPRHRCLAVPEILAHHLDPLKKTKSM